MGKLEADILIRLVMVPVKPHIKAFYATAYGDPMHLTNLNFHTVVKSVLTADRARSWKPLEAENYLRIILPRKLSGMYVDRAKANDLGSVLETFFWERATRIITTDMMSTNSMKESIEGFYKEYGINEDMYAVENFRRQLHRFNCINRLPQSESHLKRRTTKLSANDRRRIKDLYPKHSLRALARMYKVHYTTIRNVLKAGV